MDYDFISLQEATQLSGKSIRTIQRLAKKLRESEPSTISTRTNEKGIEEQTIDREVLLAYYPPEEKKIDATSQENEESIEWDLTSKLSMAYRYRYYYEDLALEKEEKLEIVLAEKAVLKERNLRLKYWLIGTFSSIFLAFVIRSLYRKLK